MADLQRVMVVLTSVLAVCAIVGGGIAIFQSDAAKRAAQASERSARVAEDALDSNNESFQDTLIQMKAQSRAVQHGSKAAQQSADVARDALASAQRAFVTYTQNLGANAVTDETNRQRVVMWEFSPILVNSGSTPTRNGIEVFNSGHGGVLQDTFTFRDAVVVMPTLFTLSPRDTKSGALLPITPEVLQHVRNQTEHLYFWGWITYNDIFQGTPVHISMICAEMTGVRGDPTALNLPVTWSQCTGVGARHNCSDEECSGQPYGNGLIWHQRH